MKDIFTFDIETVPIERLRPGGDAYEIDGYWEQQRYDEWLRKGEQWEEWQTELEDFRASWREQGSAPLALTGQLPSCHPTTAHIVSVSHGMHTEGARDAELGCIQLDEFAPLFGEVDEELKDPEKRPRRLDEFDPKLMRAAERKVIRLALDRLAWAVERNMTLVSFNGKQFDFPMLRWRAAMLNVKMPRFNWYEMLYPYRHKEHVDLRLLFSDGDRRAKGTLEMWCNAFGLEAEESGHQVLEWAMRGQWDEIRRYGAVEQTSLIELFRAVESAL